MDRQTFLGQWYFRCHVEIFFSFKWFIIDSFAVDQFQKSTLRSINDVNRVKIYRAGGTRVTRGGKWPLQNFLNQIKCSYHKVFDLIKVLYSGGNSYCNKALFMKQKCQIQMGVGLYKNAATPLRTRGINTTHQHFQMRYITLIYLKGLKSYWLK